MTMFNADVTTESFKELNRSEFANTLSEIFTYCQSQVDKEILELKESEKNPSIKQMVKHVRKTIETEIGYAGEAIKRHTGIDIDVHIPDNGTAYPICIYLNPGLDILELSEALGYATTGGSIIKTQDRTQLVNQVIEISKRYDEEKGIVVDTDKKLETTGKKIKATLIFCPIVTFLSRHYVNEENELKDAMTPNEAVAITLHEVGHMVSLVQNIGNMAFIDKAVSRYVSGVSRSSFADISKDTKRIVDAYGERRKRDESSETIKNLGKVADKMIEDEDSIFDAIANNAKLSTAILSTAIATSISSLAAISYGMIVPVISSLLYSLSSAYPNDVHSDIPLTDKRYTTFEFWADDFVVKHGMGGYLATALTKYTQLWNNASVPFAANPRVRKSYIVSQYIGALTDISGVLGDIFAVYLSTPHGSEKDRFSNIIQGIYATLKDESTPLEIKQDLVRQARAIRELQQKRHNSPLLKVMSFTKHFTDKALTLYSGHILKVIFEGDDIRDELRSVVESVNAISNNSLSYHASRLESLK